MIKRIGLLWLLAMSVSFVKSQEIAELFNNMKYEKLAKYSDKLDSLTSKEIFYVGFSLFQLKDDKKALEIYDIAIEKGLDEDFIYYYKALAYRYSERNLEAVKYLKIAIEKNPENQQNVTELGNTFLLMKEVDSAMFYYRKARPLKFYSEDPYYLLPNYYKENGDYKKALEEFEISLSFLKTDNQFYTYILFEITDLHYNYLQEYSKAIKGYELILKISPKNYDVFPFLIKAYNNTQQGDKADSLLRELKMLYQRGALSANIQQTGSVEIDAFKSNGYYVGIYMLLSKPSLMYPMIHQIYVLDSLNQVVRTFFTERIASTSVPGEFEFRFSERLPSTETFVFNLIWTVNNFSRDALHKGIVQALNEELDGILIPKK